MNVADKYPSVVERLLKLAEKAREELGDWNGEGTDQKALQNYSGNANKPGRNKKKKEYLENVYRL